MWGHSQVQFVAELGEGIGSDLPATCGREHQRVGSAVAVGACLVDHGERLGAQRHPELAADLGALACDRPDVAFDLPFTTTRRGDSGLTTLEWLLIVAAVAGLAALAVVLVQNVVSDTSEQIEGSSARQTAAAVAAAGVQAEAVDPTQVAERFGSTPSDATWAEWARYYTQKCDRIGITYSDAGITVTATYTAPTTGGTAYATALNGADATTAAAAMAAAACEIS